MKTPSLRGVRDEAIWFSRKYLGSSRTTGLLRRGLIAMTCLCVATARCETIATAGSEFETADGVSISLCAKEPLIAQPVYLTFDERGRMWVVQYLQYPFPEGLKVVGHDMYWRVKYDNWPPPPPPQGPKGRDRVTILEDTDGDGNFESAKDFVTGLNITTAALPGKGGIWVMNPPYLLFYADENKDDVPDGDPVVHLAGFGLEDMHAVANSLMWGPDGWIYGCQGSTCKASITQPGVSKPPVDFSGQCIWRYEPNRKTFEVFAEGGYNNFGIAMDSAGRMFTGSNGGLIGVYYVQGGYYWKNWGKHGPHSNPYTFGYLPSMPDESSKAKLSQGMAWYEGGALPEVFNNKLIVARVMQHRIDYCSVTPDKSNFDAKELGPLVKSNDFNFRPVDVKVGPDGAVYVADWYDDNVTWQVSAEKQSTARDTGRIYRIAGAGVKPFEPFDLSKEPTEKLADLSVDGNYWERFMALRMLRERGDSSAGGRFHARIENEKTKGQHLLSAIWGLNAVSPKLVDEITPRGDANLRRWLVRLLGDSPGSKLTGASLTKLASEESDPEVRVQYAATAKRLPASSALPLIDALTRLAGAEDDSFLPLMTWWTVEQKLTDEAEATRAWILKEASWDTPLFAREVVPRLGRRCMEARSPAELLFAAQLLAHPAVTTTRLALLGGMEQGLRGAPITDVPEALKTAVGALLVDSAPDGKLINVAMQLGVGDMAGVALEALKSGRLAGEDRQAVLRMLAEQRSADLLPLLLAALKDGPSNDDRAAAIDGLQHYNAPEVASALVDAVPQLDAATGDKALGILVTRKDGALKLFEAVDAGKILPKRVALDLLATARGLNDDAVNALLTKHYGNVRKSPEELAKRVQEVRDALDTAAGVGMVDRGKVVFGETCAKCHILFGEGRKVGPELTGIERTNREQLIQSIVDPSATVLPEFMATTFTIQDTSDNDPLAEGRQVTGFLVQETPQAVTLIDSAGNELTVPPAQVLKREPMQVSLMPTGLLDAITPQQIRDLFAYVQSNK